MKNKTAKRARKAYLRSFRSPWRPKSEPLTLIEWLKSQMLSPDDIERLEAEEKLKHGMPVFEVVVPTRVHLEHTTRDSFAEYVLSLLEREVRDFYGSAWPIYQKHYRLSGLRHPSMDAVIWRLAPDMPKEAHLETTVSGHHAVVTMP